MYNNTSSQNQDLKQINESLKESAEKLELMLSEYKSLLDEAREIAKEDALEETQKKLKTINADS